MSQSKKRRKWSASKKLELVLAGMEAGTEISELSIYGDRGNAKAGASKPDPKEEQLNRLRAVIAEITAENLELKKTL